MTIKLPNRFNYLGTYTCPECKETFRLATSIRKHLWEIHRIKVKPKKNKVSKCANCEYEVVARPNMCCENCNDPQGDKFL